MAYSDTIQYLNEAFDTYRRGSAVILNEERLVVTVDGDHGIADKRYSKWSGDSYELAEIQISGDYHPNGKPRPFMYMLKEKIEENHGHYAKEIFNENIWYDRHEHGWFVEWDAVCYQLENVCIQNLMPEVSAELPPVTSKTQKKKSQAGYGDMTLFASGQLVRSIHVEIGY